MGRPKKTVPPIRVGIALPATLVERIDSHLTSEVENRIPHGVKSAFFEQLVREFFQRLDGTFSEIESSLGERHGMEV
jgi:hypothetical protein